MRVKPRIKIINHRVRDETSMRSELNMDWEKSQVINDALSHVQRACKGVPDSIVTSNQIETVKRALGHLRQEIDVAIKLLLDK